MFNRLLFTASTLLLSACATAPPPTPTQPIGVWAQVAGTNAWSLRLPDIERGEPLYVSVSVPTKRPASITVVRACLSGGRKEISDVHLSDQLAFTLGCDGKSFPLSSDLVTELSQMPEPPLEIKQEVVDLLLHCGQIADSSST